MKIVDVSTYVVGNAWKNWVFCEVKTDEGLTGIGEGTLNGFARTVEAAIHELFYLVRGQNPFDIEKLTLRMWRDYYSDGGQIQGSALAAIETALWDIKGKALGVPVYELLGGKVHDRLRVYANGWYRGGKRTPENFYDQARHVVERGYTALKFDPFGTAWRVVDRRDFDLAVEIVEAVRDAVGPAVDVLIEGHNRFSPSSALAFAEALAPYRPTWFEAPVPPQRISSIAYVAERSPVPIACGEDYYCREQFAELLERDAVSIIQLEPQFLGLTGSKVVAGMVHAHNGVIAPHSAQGPICSLVCAHLNTATPNFFLHEFFDEFNESWESSILTEMLHVKDGYIEVPSTPGLGAELNPEEIRKRPYQPTNFLPLFTHGWERRIGDVGEDIRS